MTPKFLTTGETAFEIRSTKRFVRSEISRGKIKNVKVVGRKYLIPRESIEAYLQQRSLNFHHG